MDTHNATSSPESGDGHSPLNSRVGQTASPFGPDLARANLSARQAQALGLLTSGTYGQRGSTSSESAALTSCLANKLEQQLSTDGSILCRQTWKQKVTPSGALYWEHTASGHRTSGKGFTSLPTPVASEERDCALPIVLAKCDKGGRIGRWICSRSMQALTHQGPVTLNPSFAGALMGYPPEWDDCADMETP